MAARERVLVEAMRVAGQRSGTVPHIYTVPQMRFVVRLLRYRGRILPWRDVMNQEPKCGDLRIEECLDKDLRRYVRTARLFDEANVLPSRPLPELLDVRLLAMSPQAFTLTGFERAGGVEYAQSWLVSDRRS
jgi:hypothetical protein